MAKSMTKNEYALSIEVLAKSEAKDWHNAKLEWKFISGFKGKQDCVCGHRNITNICVIRNTKNENELEVGNCCVKNFLDINNGDNIFKSICSLEKDIRNSISKESLKYLKEYNLISDWDVTFYKGISTFSLTEKQYEQKERINRIFAKLVDRFYTDEKYSTVIKGKPSKPTAAELMEIARVRKLSYDKFTEIKARWDADNSNENKIAIFTELLSTRVGKLVRISCDNLIYEYDELVIKDYIKECKTK